LLLFSGLIAGAVRLRHRPEAHKRLMLLAFLSFMGPVVSRLAQQGLPIDSVTPVVVGGVLALAVCDLASARRIHEATMWGGVATLGGLALAALVAGRASDATVAAFLPPRLTESVHPVLLVSNVRTSTEWYLDVLGFSALAMADTPDPPVAIVTREGLQVLLQRSSTPITPQRLGAPASAGWPARRLDAYLRVKDVKAFHEMVRAHVQDLEPVIRTDYGCNEFALQDPDSHIIVVSECHF